MNKERKLHSVLERQLKKSGLDCAEGNCDPKSWQKFLASVSRAYHQADDDRYTIERSLEISSKEMQELYSELKRSSESLLAQERDKLKAIISSIGDGLCVLNSDGTIFMSNEQAAQILQVHSTDLLGRNLQEFIRKDGACDETAFMSLLATESRESGEGQFELDNGAIIPVNYTITPLTLSVKDDKPGAVVIFRDISEQKAQEEELKEARDQALLGSKMKSEFLASMSHEIRTPLNGIVSLAHLLLDSELDEEQADDVDTLVSCCYSLKAIIDNILDFSKIEAGKLYLTEKEFPIRGLIERTVQQVAQTCREESIEVVVSVASDVPSVVYSDDLRVQQILTNLLSNAIKFTPEGGGIVVTVERDDTSSDISQLLIHVSDTGIGIPEAKISEIFMSFTQADGSITRRFGGTGLGLSISTKLAELLGGTMEVKSREGVGSCFTCRIELKAPENQEVHVRERYKPAAVLENENHRNLLLVEDNPINQNTVSRVLKRLGHTITLAENGREALDRLNSGETYDLILMDLHMPEMGGIEASKNIRKREDSMGTVPIIALTADAIIGTEQECTAAGMNAYVTKPIDYDKLIATITKLTGGAD